MRATLPAFFALSYGVTLASHEATIGIPTPTWLAAGILIPFAFFGGLAGRPIGDRLGAEAFSLLARWRSAAPCRRYSKDQNPSFPQRDSKHRPELDLAVELPPKRRLDSNTFGGLMISVIVLY